MPISQQRNGSGLSEPGLHVRGAYAKMLQRACREQLYDTSRALLDSAEARVTEAAYEADLAERTEALFAERAKAGEPVIAWWYWLADAGMLPLPEPLHRVGNANGPRRVQVCADDRIVEVHI